MNTHVAKDKRITAKTSPKLSLGFLRREVSTVSVSEMILIHAASHISNVQSSEPKSGLSEESFTRIMAGS